MITVNSVWKYSNPRWNRKNILKARRLNQKFRKSKSKQTWLYPKKVEISESYGTFKFFLLKTCLLSCDLNIKKKQGICASIVSKIHPKLENFSFIWKIWNFSWLIQFHKIWRIQFVLLIYRPLDSCFEMEMKYIWYLYMVYVFSIYGLYIYAFIYIYIYIFIHI